MHFKHLVFTLSAVAMAAALPSVEVPAAAPSAAPAAPAAAPPTAVPMGVFNKTTKKCDVGKLNCCKSFQKTSNNIVQTVTSAFGIVGGVFNGQVGAQCNNIGAWGEVGGNSCQGSPACCTTNEFTGIGTLGCSPILGNL